MSEQPTKPAKSKLVLILVGVIVLLLAGGGAAGYWFYTHRGAQPAAPPPPPKPGIVALDPFVVNLADGGGARFLRVAMRLLVENEHQAVEVKEDDVAQARMRSAILELLSQQKADRLVTPEGKSEVKKAIAERAAQAMHDLKVTDVLFSEFVVQF